MKKTTKMERGKVVPWKMKNDEEQLVLDWINAQTITSDSLRYLVQQEIALNGIRDLQFIIPQNRTIESIKQTICTSPNQPSSIIEQAPVSSFFQKEVVVMVDDVSVEPIQDKSTSTVSQIEVEIVKEQPNKEIVEEPNKRVGTAPKFSVEEMESYG